MQNSQNRFDHIFDQNCEIFFFALFLQKTKYPGVAQLVGHLIWVQDAGSSNLPTRTIKNGCFRKKSAVFLTFYVFLVSTARDLTTYYFFAFPLFLQTFFLYKCRYFFYLKPFPNPFVSFGVTRTECFKNDPKYYGHSFNKVILLTFKLPDRPS